MCRLEKPEADFNRSHSTKRGYCYRCRACDAAYYEANKVRHKATIYAWRASHPEEHKQRNADYHRMNPRTEYYANYRANNRQECNARSADWLKKNKERKKFTNDRWLKYNKEEKALKNELWRLSNLDRECAKAARYRAAKMQACPLWADLNEIGLIYAQSQIVSRETGVEHHVDHIVPLQSKRVCGLHVTQNLRVIPGKDNMSKSNRTWPDDILSTATECLSSLV